MMGPIIIKTKPMDKYHNIYIYLIDNDGYLAFGTSYPSTQYLLNFNPGRYILIKKKHLILWILSILFGIFIMKPYLEHTDETVKLPRLYECQAFIRSIYCFKIIENINLLEKGGSINNLAQSTLNFFHYHYGRNINANSYLERFLLSVSLLKDVDEVIKAYQLILEKEMNIEEPLVTKCFIEIQKRIEVILSCRLEFSRNPISNLIDTPRKIPLGKSFNKNEANFITKMITSYMLEYSL